MSAAAVRSVHDMEIDEVSLVDRPANQHSAVLITKAYQGDDMPDEFEEIEVFKDGVAVSEQDLTHGDVVTDADGNQYVYETENDIDHVDDRDYAPRELASVGKSAGVSPAFSSPVSKGIDSAAALREALSKAVTESDRDEVIAKALSQIDGQSAVIKGLTDIAKGERDLRLDREYIEVAKAYNIPSDPDELGPVLKRMAESMDDADCAVIHKALTSAGDTLFHEFGYEIVDANSLDDPYSQAVYAAEAAVSKSAGAIDPATAIEKFFEDNPQAYDDYVAERR